MKHVCSSVWYALNQCSKILRVSVKDPLQICSSSVLENDFNVKIPWLLFGYASSLPLRKSASSERFGDLTSNQNWSSKIGKTYVWWPVIAHNFPFMYPVSVCEREGSFILAVSRLSHMPFCLCLPFFLATRLGWWSLLISLFFQ